MKLIPWSKLRVSVRKANKYKEVTASSDISLLTRFRLDPVNADILPSETHGYWVMPGDVDWSGFPEEAV